MNDNDWMGHAWSLAKHAERQDEVPVGAVVVLNHQIIGTGWNQPISSNDPTAHAEIIALREAGKTTGNYRLLNAVMYVTLEPCAMCAGAIIHARLARLVYAVSDPNAGACGSVLNVLNHHTKIEQGLMEDDCRTLIQNFFRQKRIK